MAHGPHEVRECGIRVRRNQQVRVIGHQHPGVNIYLELALVARKIHGVSGAIGQILKKTAGYCLAESHAGASRPDKSVVGGAFHLPCEVILEPDYLPQLIEKFKLGSGLKTHSTELGSDPRTIERFVSWQRCWLFYN
jgi:hypothetical protein